MVCLVVMPSYVLRAPVLNTEVEAIVLKEGKGRVQEFYTCNNKIIFVEEFNK